MNRKTVRKKPHTIYSRRQRRRLLRKAMKVVEAMRERREILEILNDYADDREQQYGYWATNEEVEREEV